MRVEWERARRLAWAAGVPLPAAEVPLAGAQGGTLAVPLRAVTPVRAGPVPADRAPLAVGTAVEIATGAAVPPGTAAVVPYERATRVGDRLEAETGAGRHVRRAGEDVPADADLLGPGVPVGPTVLGLAAAVGLDTLPVRPRPRVAVLLTGGELVH